MYCYCKQIHLSLAEEAYLQPDESRLTRHHDQRPRLDFTGTMGTDGVAVLDKGQIHVGDAAVIKHLADYSTSRLVEYFDNNPCRLMYPESRAMDMIAKFAAPGHVPNESGRSA
jgi:hypothetical protein